MTDSLKVLNALSESENCSYPVGLAECRRDETSTIASGSEVNLSEGSHNSIGTANVHALRGVYPAQDICPIIPQSTPDRDSALMNPAGWDSRRHTGVYSTSSAYALHNYVESHPFALRSSVTTTARNLTGLSPLTQSHVSFARSSVDHIPFPHAAPPPDHPLSFTPSVLNLQQEHPIPVGGHPLPSGAEENISTTSQPLSRSTQPLPIDHDHIPNAERVRALVSSHHSAFTSDPESGHWAPVTFNYTSDLPDRGSLSEPDHHSETRRSLRHPRRSPRVQGGPITPGPFATEETSSPPSSVHSVSRSHTFRSRHISVSSRVLSPLDVGVGSYQAGVDDGDNLPALLSPSDGSELDRPPSPDTTAGTDTDSQAVSEDSRPEDGRTRFLHPGTPIQTELPELQSLLEFFQTEGGDTRRVWMTPDNNVSPEQLDNHMSQDDDDIAGDTQRAMELLDGLEQVDSELVRRYEKVRGDGHDICTICRDCLLPPEDKQSEVVDQFTDSATAWNALASAALPFQPPPLGAPIHAFPCTHLFHTACLVPWLCLKTTCPTCRLDIDPHSLTLRVRGWASSRWPHIDNHQERQYVNVDVLGRRIAWRRPPAPTLEEWVEGRENETHRQTEERLRLHSSSRRQSEPLGDPDRRVQSRRRTLSEPHTANISHHPPVMSLGLRISESSGEPDLTMGYLGPQTGPHDPDIRYGVGHGLFDEPLSDWNSTPGSLIRPQPDANYAVRSHVNMPEVIHTAPQTVTTTNVLMSFVSSSYDPQQPTSSTDITLPPTMLAANQTSGVAPFARIQDELSGNFRRSPEIQEHPNRTQELNLDVERRARRHSETGDLQTSQPLSTLHLHTTQPSRTAVSIPVGDGAPFGIGALISPSRPYIRGIRSHDASRREHLSSSNSSTIAPTT